MANNNNKEEIGGDEEMLASAASAAGGYLWFDEQEEGVSARLSGPGFKVETLPKKSREEACLALLEMITSHPILAFKLGLPNASSPEELRLRFALAPPGGKKEDKPRAGFWTRFSRKFLEIFGRGDGV